MTAAALLIGLIIVALFAVGVVGVTIAAFLWSSRRKTTLLSMEVVHLVYMLLSAVCYRINHWH